ncbi:Increased DNA methylation 1 [Sesamum angolense]|uniref:Increased DNA methylation 1 n=1 Tax=Sesamum angolense TaxID=2727404 RepID=A0AAE1WD05_9LAMI|nr:Increased DNA methylation 1 [Sesamum angolense]
MGEGSGEVEDELIDLNKEPVERKRKRVEKKNSTDKGNEGSDGLPRTGRVSRSRTLAMSDGEKQVIKMEIVKMEDKDESKTLAVEDKDENKVPVLQKRKKMKGRRGRPPKKEGKCEVSVLPSHRKKGRRGRPPKLEGKYEISSLSYRKKDGKVMERKKVAESPNGAGRGRGRPKVKRKRGRPRKTENGSTGMAIKRKNVKKNSDHEQSAKGDPAKRLNVDTNDLENGGTMQKVTVGCAEGNDLGLREQKQLVRDQIVAMLKKAGWTVEFRQRQSKDYQDAVYVDREGRTHWSVTLAYKKLKKKIDEGKAEDRDVSAFSPIPEETLSMLFRITTKGKKAGRVKNGAGKTVKRMTKKEPSKSKSLEGRIKSRSGRGKQRILLARRPSDGSDGNNYELYEGKRTLLSWMIDLGTVPLGGKVKYKRGRGKKIQLEGRALKEGICCDCCNITHTIRDFESHAESTPGKPYQNIYLDSGNSLFQCLVDSWKKHVETDNIGFVCVDVEGDDPNDDTCNVCGDGVHAHCTKGTTAEDFDDENPSFCGEECSKIFEQLQVLLGVRHELEGGFSYTVLQHCVVNDDASRNGDSSAVESNSKLAVAFTVMDECFQPIIDERSGTNMIHNVVYSCGSNIRRLNYNGFYTIILEKGDELVSAASIRIHGSKLAEMPFIGTRYMYRRQGMCSRLLAATEMVLCSLGVEKLVIPAISELNETWTKVFGFVPLEESKRQELRYMSMIVFPGIDMLQKPLLGQDNKGLINSAGCTEVTTENQNMQENPASDSKSQSDVKIQNQFEAAPVKSSANARDASATESTEVETHNQNTQEEQIEDSGGVAASDLDLSPRLKIDNNNDAAVESGDPMAVSSFNEADTKFGTVNDGEALDTGNCLNQIDTNADGNVEAPQSAAETNSCSNGLLSENGKFVNCNHHDILEENPMKRRRILRDRSALSQRNR